jgi:hypothetical protein
MEDLYLRGRLRNSFLWLAILTVVVAGLGFAAIHTLLGWVLLACTALIILGVWPYMIYATGHELRADASGLSLLWRGRERRAFHWDEVAGFAWVQRYAGKGMPTFFVARTDGSTSRLPLPLYTKAGMKQAESIIDYWRGAVPGLILLDGKAPNPLPLRRAGSGGVADKWYRADVPDSRTAP